MSAAAVVDAFMDAMHRRDFAAGEALLTDDLEYENVPMGRQFGPKCVQEVLEPFFNTASELEFVVHRQIESGGTVMNERTDRFLIGGKWVDLRCMGLFVVRDGKICLWRDYFDLPTFQGQIPQP